MKKVDVILSEYARKLSDDDLMFLGSRFKQGLCGDTADIANFVSRDNSVDKWLSTATSGPEWFDMIERLGASIKEEYERRNRRDKD